MDAITKPFSPFSCQFDNTRDDDIGTPCLCSVQQPLAPTDREQRETIQPYNIPLPISTTPVTDQGTSSSPLSQDSTTNMNPRRHLAVRRNNSPISILSSPGSLEIPSLRHVSPTKDQEEPPGSSPTSTYKDPMFVVSNDGPELELALPPSLTQSFPTEVDNIDKDVTVLNELDAVAASRLSFEELERKTDQIIHEARMALRQQRHVTMKLSEINPSIHGPLIVRPSTVPSTPDSPDTHHLHSSSSYKRTGQATMAGRLSPISRRLLNHSDGRPPLSPATPSGSTPHPPTNVHMHWPSPAESTLASNDDDDDDPDLNNLPFQLRDEALDVSREKVLRRIDGLASSPMATPYNVGEVDYRDFDAEILVEMPNRAKKFKTVVITSPIEEKKSNQESQMFGTWLSFLWGRTGVRSQPSAESDEIAETYEESILPMTCGTHGFPTERNDLLVASQENEQGYAHAVNARQLYIDPRMPEWMDKHLTERDPLPKGTTYQLGESRTIIVHEMIRGSWTWCTAWSPDGSRLAMGTENHHFAVVDTFSSSVWRIKHDKRVAGPTRGSDVTHSIRSIAWGNHFIAIGGVGGSVSILSTNEPYPILHKITPTGFVGSLDWLKDTTTLAIGSRDGKAMVVKVFEDEDETSSQTMDHERKVNSIVLHTIDREGAWVNAVKFSPGGKALAFGDSKGILGVYGYQEKAGVPIATTNIANFKLEDSILDIEWSPDGQWLYAGGEDFCVTVINTPSWEAVHRIKRDRWVQFISACHGGSHIAIGGISSEVAIMDVDRGWDSAMNIGLKGLVPLSAKWHPQDQYLVVTGQNNSVLAIETTNSRYVPGHFLRSASPILAIQFSPDGRMVAVGNEAGIVTIFKLSGTSFITIYELVLDGDGSLSIKWSTKGTFLAIVAGKKVVIVTKSSLVSEKSPPNTSGFHVSQVIRHSESVQDVALSPNGRYMAVSGIRKTRFLDVGASFKSIREVASEGTAASNSWSPDGVWFATVGANQHLLIYDTSSPKVADWKVIFTVQISHPGLTLAWGPAMVGGLQYLAYGGEGSKIYVMEIRTRERAWETVLAIPREGVIHALDWNNEGLLAAAVGNGTVSVIDLSYLQSGWAVNEMDYNWQRQALTCFTEIRRNKGTNSMKSVRWIPSAPGSDSLLACGGTDGEIEIIDLTNRRRCTGFNSPR